MKQGVWRSGNIDETERLMARVWTWGIISRDFLAFACMGWTGGKIPILNYGGWYLSFLYINFYVYTYSSMLATYML